MHTYIGVDTFEALAVPLKVVAADFWNRREVVFDSGPLVPALSASFSLPGIFKPVQHEDVVLVDGGCVNPVPFDLLRDSCDIVIAVDVLGTRVPDDDDPIPGFADALLNTFQIAETSIAEQKRLIAPPDIYLDPDIRDVRVLEFHKGDQIYEQSAAECERLRAELGRLLEG